MLRRLPSAPALIFTVLIGLAPAAVAAQDPRVLRGELQAKSLARDDAKVQSQNLRQEVAKLNAQLTELNAVTAAGEQGARDRRSRLEALNAREAQLRAEMGKSQAGLARLLGALELYRREPPPALLVSPRSAQDAVRAAILIRAVEPELHQRAAVLKARAEELQRLRRGIVAANEDLMTSESTLAENRAELERSIREKSAVERQLDADVADYGRRADLLTGQLRALGASLRGPAAPAGLNGPLSSLLAPAQGALTRRFGQIAAGDRRSDGLTWRTAPGAIVKAPAGGLVEFSGPLKDGEGVLIMNLGGGYRVVLAGMDRIAAPAGRMVPAGQGLGSMAQTSSPELYMELRKDGAPIDPARWLRPALPGLAERRGAAQGAP